MPSDAISLPAEVNELPDSAKAIWIKAFTDALEDHKGNTKRAEQSAWGVVDAIFEKIDGEWVHRSWQVEVLQSLGIRKHKKQQSGNIIIAGYGSVEMIDPEGDLITKEALASGLQKWLNGDPDFLNIMLEHESIQVGRVLKEFKDEKDNVWKTEVDGNGFFLVAEIVNNSKIGSDLIAQIVNGEYRCFSIGANVIKRQDFKIESGEKVVKIDDIEIHEVTICKRGMNPGAKFDIIDKEKRIKELEKEVKEITTVLGDLRVNLAEGKLEKPDDTVEKNDANDAPSSGQGMTTHGGTMTDETPGNQEVAEAVEYASKEDFDSLKSKFDEVLAAIADLNKTEEEPEPVVASEEPSEEEAVEKTDPVVVNVDLSPIKDLVSELAGKKDTPKEDEKTEQLAKQVEELQKQVEDKTSTIKKLETKPEPETEVEPPADAPVDVDNEVFKVLRDSCYEGTMFQGNPTLSGWVERGDGISVEEVAFEDLIPDGAVFKIHGGEQNE